MLTPPREPGNCVYAYTYFIYTTHVYICFTHTQDYIVIIARLMNKISHVSLHLKNSKPSIQFQETGSPDTSFVKGERYQARPVLLAGRVPVS